MSGYEDIRLEIDDAVARITVARPAKLNAMRDRTATELLSAFVAARETAGVRAVVLTGEGRAFGAGYDLATIDPEAEPALDDVLDTYFNPLIREMRTSPLPVVSAINGACAGASVGLALAGDIVVAARSAYFYEPFVGIALVPDAGNTSFLPRIAGRIRASAAMLLGERITAEEARDWGLVWRVVADDELAGTVDGIAATLAARSPDAVAATKRLIAAESDPRLDTGLDAERDAQGERGRSPEMKTAIADFFAGKG